eukprot:1139274-Pelagomonas_calceolata.AAC.2
MAGLGDPGVASELLCFSSITIPDYNELHRIRNRKFGKHFCKIWVMVKPTHVGVAAKASPVGQKHEGGNWLGGLEGGVCCVVHEFEHNFVIMRGMAEGKAIVANREGVCVRPEDLVTVACAEIGVEDTVKFKRVGEPLC